MALRAITKKKCTCVSTRQVLLVKMYLSTSTRQVLLVKMYLSTSTSTFENIQVQVQMLLAGSQSISTQYLGAVHN